MDCRQVEDLLLDYLEQELDSAGSAAVEEHLRGCSACRQYRDDLKSTLSELSQAAGSFSEPPPDSFVGYQLVREIHRGGQGVVYQAVQQSTKRKVALKVMKEGPFAGPSDKARFDREVQVLGQLNHPSIVAIHDTGVAAGCHYFVMDYISGQPLDVYIASSEWSVEETLRLFVRICEAVNAAHLHGVIHRDLKPSNIRVDAAGQPHILDFGLAKVASGDPAASAMTMTGQFVGSLPWASPEQAEGSPGKIDLRTDVYSLGVILYQMLTSKFPYDVTGNMHQILDRIMLAQPLRPSAIRRQINDEVETLVLKCLSKERERRYQTAGELARDIQHYLDGEPIEAKRDSVGYVLRKQLRRYKVPTAIAAAFVLVVTVGLVASLTFWQREIHQRELADASAQRAHQEAAKAEAVSRFLQDMLASVRPSKALGREMTVREVVDESAKKIEEDSLDQQPEVDAALRTTIGLTYQALGLYEAAKPHLEAALEIRRQLFGEEHAETLLSMRLLATLYWEQGRYNQAQSLFVPTLELSRRVLGPEHADTLGTMNNLALVYQSQGRYDLAEPLLVRTLELNRRVLGEEHTDTLTTMGNLASLYSDQGRYDQAESLYREALAMKRRLLGSQHPNLALSLNNLALLLQNKGDYAEAELLFREALDIYRQVHAQAHPSVAASLNNLAGLLLARGDYAGAEPLYSEALDIYLQVHGDEHPDVAANLNNLARVRHAQGDYAGAEPLCRRALAMRRKLLGEEHPDLAESLSSLAEVLRAKGDYAEAEPLLRSALAMNRQLHGDRHPHVAFCLNNLGELLMRMGRVDEAQPMFARALELRRGLLGQDHPDTLMSLMSVGRAHQIRGQPDLAEPYYRQAVEGHVRVLGADHPRTLWVRNQLADLLHEQGQLGQAESLLRETMAILRQTLPRGRSSLASTLAMLGANLNEQREYAAAEPLLRECLEIRREIMPPEHWLLASATSLLGAALAGQDNFEQAEPLLLEGYEGMKDRPQALQDRKREALQRLVELYDAWAKPEQAFRWRGELQVLESSAPHAARKADAAAATAVTRPQDRSGERRARP